MSPWRVRATAIVGAIIKAYRGDDEAIQRVLREACPWGTKGWPYRVWRDVVREQLARYEASRRKRARANDVQLILDL